MKIAHVASSIENVPPNSKNGLEFMVSWLVEGLVKRGHEITLFAPAESKVSAKLKPLVARGISLQEIPEVRKAIIPMSIWNTLYAASEADVYDVVHFHNDAAYSAPFINKPIVQTIHGAFPGEFLAPYVDKKDNHEHMKFIFDQYAKVNYITISNKQQEIFKQHAGDLFFKKYRTIYNGIPIEQFTFNDTPKDYLLYLGYINKDKGADVAVQVAKRLNMKLILAGGNVGDEAFFDEHIKPFLNDQIQYVGAVDFDQKNELYKNAVATLAPLSWHEPFGLTLVESQACGTPVIAFNKGAAAEIVDNGKTGFVVETIDEMCDAVGKVSTLSRKACREHVEQNFSIEKMVDEYEKFYKSLVK